MYESYWGLDRKPFDNVPDPRFFFRSQMHEEAHLRLLYSLKENKGGAMLSGEYGCGKTMLIRLIISEIAEAGYEIAFINNPRWKPDEMWQEILYEFGEEQEMGNDSAAYRVLGDLLYRNVERGLSNLVVVDEAQLIREDSIFEELRLLLNFQLEDRFLVNLFLVGQPELRERVMAIPELDQRIAVKYHLYPFNQEDTRAYIKFRLGTAGLEAFPFTDEAVEETHKLSMGSPRRINNVCDMALLTAFHRKVKVIDDEIIRSVN